MFDSIKLPFILWEDFGPFTNRELNLTLDLIFVNGILSKKKCDENRLCVYFSFSFLDFVNLKSKSMRAQGRCYGVMLCVNCRGQCKCTDCAHPRVRC